MKQPAEARPLARGSGEGRLMPDQADRPRQLAAASSPLQPPRSLVFTSGKGGVGTSNLALNLAIALGERGQRVVLVDADLGLANIDLLCGLAPACDLGDVLGGGRPLADAIVDGPGRHPDRPRGRTGRGP